MVTGTIRPPAKKATSVGFLWLWLNIRGKTPKSNGWWSDCHFAYPATLQWIGVYPINGQPHLWVAMAEVAGRFREHGLHAGRFHDSERRHSRQRWDSADLQKWVSERSGEACGKGPTSHHSIGISWQGVWQPSIPRAVARPMARGNQFIIYMSWSFVSPKDERQALRMSTVAAKLHILSGVSGNRLYTPWKPNFFWRKWGSTPRFFSFSGVPTKPLPFHCYQPEARPLNLGDIARFGSTNGHKP